MKKNPTRNLDSHSFSVQIAIDLKNVNEAIMIQHFSFWHKKNKVDAKRCFDKGVWFYCSIEGFVSIFPYLSAKGIRGAIDRLMKKELVMIGEFNKLKFDRTKWYSLTMMGMEFTGNEMPEKSNKYTFTPKGIIHLPESTSPFVQRANDICPKGNTIPDSNTNVTTDIKTLSKEKNGQIPIFDIKGGEIKKEKISAKKEKEDLDLMNLISVMKGASDDRIDFEIGQIKKERVFDEDFNENSFFSRAISALEELKKETFAEAIEVIEEKYQGLPPEEVKIIKMIDKCVLWFEKWSATKDQLLGQAKLKEEEIDLMGELDNWIRYNADKYGFLMDANINKNIVQGFGRWLKNYKGFNRKNSSYAKANSKNKSSKPISAETARAVMLRFEEEDKRESRY